MQASLGFTPQLLFSWRALHPSEMTVTTVVPQYSHNAHLMSSAILSGKKKKKKVHPINNCNICFLGINWTSSYSLVAEVPCVTSKISYKKIATVYFSGRLLSQILIARGKPQSRERGHPAASWLAERIPCSPSKVWMTRTPTLTTLPNLPRSGARRTN